MKNSSLLLAALALCARAALAQTAPAASAAPPAQAAPTASPAPPTGRGPAQSPEAAAAAQSQRLAQRLSLSPDQQTKVQAILLTQRQQAQAARAQLQGGDRRAAAQALRAGRQQADEQLRAVLTPSQFTQYEALREDMREQARARRKGGE